VTTLYLGTQTLDTQAEGIYRCDWDSRTGRFSAVDLVAPAANPTFLVLHGDLLLAVNELSEFDGEDQGAVSAYRASGARLELCSMVPSHGVDPCHLAVRGEEVAVANYGGGSVALLRLEDGALTQARTVVGFAVSGPHRRQEGSHPHGAFYHGDLLLVPDLGGDCVHRLRAGSGDRLEPLRTAAGSGPRHLAGAPAGRIYVVNELANTVDVFADGRLLQTVGTLPEDASVRSATAGIQLTPAGDRLFVSNRGHDSLVSWPVGPDGRLGTPSFCPSGGEHPRHFVVDGDWALVANRDSSNVVARRLEPDGSFGAEADRATVPSPVCIAMASPP
jgi:6-phosphogluconolactonase